MKFLTHKQDSTSNNYGNFEDSGVSGVATSADVHSIEYDEPVVVIPVPGATEAMSPSQQRNQQQQQHQQHHLPSCHHKGPVSRISSISATSTQSTIKQHYYPEGGWGFVVVIVSTLVAVLNHGLHMSSGVILLGMMSRFNTVELVDTGLLEIDYMLISVF